MTTDILPILANNTLPPGVDHLHIDAGGAVRIGRGGGLVEFGFHFMNVHFTALTRQIQSGPIVQISGDIAPLPFSAEGVANPERNVADVRINEHH